MYKKFLTTLTALACALLFTFALVGCGEDEQAAVPQSGSVWQYEYAGVEHPYLTAISNYLAQYDVDNLELADGMIPCITSIEIDNEDPADIKMWGIFDIYNYTLADGTLTEQNGTRLLGMFNMSQDEESGVCTINDAQFVEPGDEAAIKELCKGHAMALAGLTHPKVTKETRRWYVSEYVKAAGLEATQYQTAKGAVVPLEYEAKASPKWVSKLAATAKTDSLIVVDITIGSNAILTMHEKKDGKWMQTLDEAAFIGKNGPGKTKEGDLMTPLGTFGFNCAFGINDDPGCKAFAYTKVDDSHYWDADSNSDRYNTLVSTNDYTDFDTEASEHIVDYPNAYKYILNTTYNDKGIPNKGSAIFLHCYREERTYTGGCISIPLEKMEYVMQNIKKDSKIVIRMKP